MHEVEQRRSSFRERAPVAPPAHFLGCLRAEQADALEKPQHPTAHKTLNDANVALVELDRGMESQPPVRVLAEGSIAVYPRRAAPARFSRCRQRVTRRCRAGLSSEPESGFSSCWARENPDAMAGVFAVSIQSLP